MTNAKHTCKQLRSRMEDGLGETLSRNFNKKKKPKNVNGNDFISHCKTAGQCLVKEIRIGKSEYSSCFTQEGENNSAGKGKSLTQMGSHSDRL